MNKKSCILFLSCVVISIILTIIFSPFDKKVISYDTIINIEIALFSVSLTIVALLITILEKYKEKIDNLADKEIITDLAEQIHTNSRICTKKAKWYNHGMRLLIFTVFLWFVCMTFRML